MADKAWKAAEREAAALFGGTRHWSNSGERLDFSSSWADGQVKLVKSLSLNALSKLAEEMAATSEMYKIAVVCTKVRRGRGKPSPMLVTMTGGEFSKLLRLMPRVPMERVAGMGEFVGTGSHREPI